MRSPSARRTAAFTLIELLVVIAIIVVMMAMLLAAIQRVREAANRMFCAHNMKQICLACHDYANDHTGEFPWNAVTKNNLQIPYIPWGTGVTPTPGKTGPTVGRCGVLVTLLPYIEGQGIADRWTFNLDWSDPANADLLKVHIKVYRCPSSPSSDAIVPPYNTTYISGGNNSFAPPSSPGSATNIFGGPVYPTTKTTSTGWTSDYAPLCQIKTKKDANGAEILCSNPFLQAVYGTTPIAPPGKGAMRQNGQTPIVHIYDGTSNTTLFSEATGRDMQWYAGHISVPYDPTSITGPIWADSDNRLTVTGTDATGMNNIGTGPYVMNTNNLQGDIYSMHTRGANIGFADGHVSFVADTIDIVLLAALVTRAGRENVQLPD